MSAALATGTSEAGEVSADAEGFAKCCPGKSGIKLSTHQIPLPSQTIPWGGLSMEYWELFFATGDPLAYMIYRMMRQEGPLA